MTNPITIKGIRLHNWRCYRGEQELELEPIVYAITAEKSNDPDRSNWLGKSSFIEAITFALTGAFIKSREHKTWLTEGETEGGVDLELSDNTLISRHRKKGGSTKLVVSWPEGEDWTEAAGDDAQTHIDDEYIDKETLSKTSLFAQKKTDQFVSMGAAKRTEIVDGWLELGLLVDAEALGRKELNDLVKKEAKLQELIRTEENTRATVATGNIMTDDKFLAMLRHQERDLAEEVNVSSKRMEVQAESQNALIIWRMKKAKHETCIDVMRKASAVMVKELSMKKPKQLHMDADHACREARAKLNDAERVARGEFDGKCPVADIKCPAMKQINAQGKASRNKVHELTLLKNELAKNKSLFAREEAMASAIQTQTRRHNEAIAAAKAQLTDLMDDYNFILKNPNPPATRAHEAHREHNHIVRDHTNAVQRIGIAEDKIAKRKVAIEQIGALTEQIAVCRQGIAVIKKSRRFIAEEALTSMQRDANEALRSSGIDLQLVVSWESEQAKLATSCDECGATYPTSQRIKNCAGCGATRPKASKQELSIQVSNVSGGATDLAGFMFQLAASTWLSRQFSIDWSVLLVDEVFGALDRTHTAALTQHLPKILTDRFGAKQAFVVAHDVSVLESTQGRITILSEGGDSKVTISGNSSS